MIEKIIYIEGMQCEHCASRVEKALSLIDNVLEVNVSLEGKKAVIRTEKEIDNNKIIEAIEDIGFIVKEIKYLKR